MAANALIEEALKACRDIGFEAAIAVVDVTGNLRAFQRADGAPFFAAEVAVSKAWTAASCGIATHVWNDFIADPKLAPLTNVNKLMAVGGGLPLFHDGKLTGVSAFPAGLMSRIARLRLLHWSVLDSRLPWLSDRHRLRKRSHDLMAAVSLPHS
jgi:uncharacterized protein GlcG (DUF336 family)